MSADPLVLIVDHAAIVRRVLVRLIERINPAASALEAGTVSEALALLAATTFSVVVTDLLLPDGSGLQILSTLKAQGSSAPVLVLSADRGLASAALAAGAQVVLHKPFDIEELNAELRRVL